MFKRHISRGANIASEKILAGGENLAPKVLACIGL